MMSCRKILHIDLDAFFCSVEELLNPKLRGKPFAVGGRPEGRGVVTSCSYAARQYGVHSAMPMAHAIKICPELIVISSNHSQYSSYSKRVMELLKIYTPLIEQVSVDEAFLDVTHQNKTAAEVAKEIQKRVNDQVNLPCSIGVASNKLVAKIANDYGKSSSKRPESPNTITTVEPGKEAEFLAKLPVRALWGVGPRTAERMSEHGIHTIGDIAVLSEPELVRLFGKHGSYFSKRSKGEDERPIVTVHEAKSISNEMTFPQDTSKQDKLEETLEYLSRKVGKRLRKQNLSARVVRVKLRWSDFTTITRQMTLDQPITLDDQIFATAIHLFNNAWHLRDPVRLLGVGLSGLESHFTQLSLWDLVISDEKIRRKGKLENAMKSIHAKYGENSLRFGFDIEVDEIG